MNNATVHPAGKHTDPRYSGYCTLVANQAQLCQMRRLTDFEVFLVLAGQAVHRANGVDAPVRQGSLVLLRPQAEHGFLQPVSADFCLMRFHVTAAVMHKVEGFLGSGLGSALAPTGGYPCHCQTGGIVFDRMLESLQTLKRCPKGDPDRYHALVLRTALDVLGCFDQHALAAQEQANPVWLTNLMQEMQKREHYARGLPAMYEITAYTPEHLCRAFRKYLHTSPTHYLNAIRLDEAALRLMYTGDDVGDIALDIGFENLSHFYHLFKQRHGLSPLRYRKLAHTAPPTEATP